MNSNENEMEQAEPMPIKFQATFSKEQFSEFYSFVNIIKPHFEDFCLVDGTFRMRSDDRRCISETKFDYLEGAYFCIVGTKLLAQMLSALSRRTAITLEIENDVVSFKDSYQSMQLHNIASEYFSDVIYSNERMEEFLRENMDPEKPLLKETLAKTLVCNIKKMAKELKTKIVKIKPLEGTPNRGCLYMTNKDAISSSNPEDNREYSVRLQNDYLIPLQENQFFHLANMPFIFDKDDMTVQYYLKERKIVMAIYDTSIGGLNIRIYGRGELREDE